MDIAHTDTLAVHSSLWGNMYRHRYYINGTRTVKRLFDIHLADHKVVKRTLHEGTSWFRITYVVAA